MSIALEVATAAGTWLEAWWPVAVLAALPMASATLVAVPFTLVHRQLGLRHDDDLPVGTGAWVEERIAAAGLQDALRVGVAPASVGHVDAYWPGAGFIGLNPLTFHKAHPAWWAIGAHELGHALTARGNVLARTVFPAARGAGMILDQLGVAALLGATVVGGAWTARLALACFAASVAVHVVVLLDEALASRRGAALLARDARLDGPRRRTARISLWGAWLTYAASFAARSVVVATFPWWLPRLDAVVGLTSAPLPHWTAVLFLAALTLLLGKRALRVAWRLVRPVQVEWDDELAHEQHREHLGDLFGGLGVAAFLVLVASVPAGPWWSAALILALVAALKPVEAVAGIALTLPVRVMLTEVDRLTRRQGVLQGHVADDAPPVSRAHKVPEVLAMHNRPPLALRLVAALRVAYLPALVGWWVWWAGSILAG